MPSAYACAVGLDMCVWGGPDKLMKFLHLPNCIKMCYNYKMENRTLIRGVQLLAAIILP